MTFFNSLSRGTAVATVVICLACSQSPAQSVWLDPSVNPNLTIEVLHPYGDYFDYSRYNDSVTFTSSVWFISGQIDLMRNTRLIIEAPIAYYKAAQYYGYYDQYWYYRVSEAEDYTYLGNPAVSIEHIGPGPWLYLQLGARAPVAEKPEAGEAQYGALADVTRFDAFAEDGYSFRARLGARIQKPNGLLYHLFVEPLYLHSTQREYRVDYEYGFGHEYSRTSMDMFLNYGGQVWLNTAIARMGAGIVGRFWMDNEGEGFGANSVHRFGFTASFGSGAVCPAFHFQVPLDRDWSAVRFVFGLDLLVRLGGKR